MSNETKKCKKCMEQINKKSKRCPKCGAKQGLPLWIIILVGVIGIAAISTSLSGNKNKDTATNTTSEKEEKIEYIIVSKDDLNSALEANPAAAKDTYKDKYVEVVGKLSNIDSDLNYISLSSLTEQIDFKFLNCRLKNNEQKDVVKTLTTNQEITVRGKIDDVGEVLGYSLDVTEIVLK